MNVIVNGQPIEVDFGSTVNHLLASRKLSPDKVAVELNRRLLVTTKYDTAIQDGDEIEIVTFVGGG
ncbi:MAG TPA: sulfur carrier protein ThiS [Tepidisphaeraceae bacterium]|jgi:thiamine biosynthesis protein ThiS